MAPRTARRIASRALALAVVASAVLAAPASALRLGPETPHSPNAEDIATSYWVMIVVSTILIVVINAALIAALLRFRERRGRTPARITAGRGVVAKVAAAFGVLAFAVLVFGIVMTERTLEVEASGPEGLGASAARTAQVGVEGLPDPAPGASSLPAGASAPLEIDAIAQQWLWRFEYPSDEREDIATLFSYGELVVPVDTAVVLNIDSTDVIHSWWVPALGGQVQAVPGTIGPTWFKADEVGVYEGQGTVFDGTSFPAMGAHVRVVEPTSYEAFVENLAADLTEAQEAVRDQASSTAEAQAQGEEIGP